MDRLLKRLERARPVRHVVSLGCAALALFGAGRSHAELRIDFDPMRPPTVAAAASPAPAASDAESPATPELPTLRITRRVSSGAGGPAVLSALVDDTR